MTEQAAPRDGRVLRWGPLVAGVALALPTLLAHYLPMSDLPLHEGVVGILRHFGDESYFPKDLYRLNLGHSNQLFHVAAWGLSYLVGTIWAVKIVVALTQIAIFAAGARFADYTGRSRWATFLLAPLALGFTYYWGLVANLVGFAGFLFALPILDRAARESTPRRAAASCAVLVLLFYAHASIFVAAAGFTATLAVAYPFDRKKTLLRLVPVVFAPVTFTAYYFWSKRYFTGGQSAPPPTFTGFFAKMSLFPNVIFGSHEAPVRLLMLVLCVLAMATFLVTRLRERNDETAADGAVSRLRRAADLLLRYRFEATGFAFLLCFVVAPFQWNGATMVYERFAGPAWAVLVLMSAPRSDPTRIAKLVSAVVPVGILLLSWPQFVDADRTFRNLDLIIAQIPKSQATALVAVDRPIFHTRVYSASVGPARAVADRGGRMGLSLVISPLSPVQIRPEYRWDEYDRRTLLFGSRALVPGHDLDRFGWVIAQSREIEVRDILIEAFKPDAELVDVQGEWLLFRSRHPQVPLTSPDVPPPPGKETILDRVRYFAMVRYEMQQRQQQGTGAAPPSPPPEPLVP